MNATSPPSGVIERFEAILTDLVKEIVAQRGRSRAFGVLAYLLWNRIMRVSARVAKVIRAIEAGTVRPWPLERLAGRRKRGPLAEPERRRFSALAATWNLMRKWPGWLVGEGGYKVAAYLSQLSYLLEQPEVKRLLAASPRLGMAMRPVCRMLGVDPRLYENVQAPAEVAEVSPPVVEAPPVRVKARVEDNEAGIPWWQQKWAH